MTAHNEIPALRDLTREVRQLQQSETISGYRSVLDRLDRITDDAWLLDYYKAICFIRMSFLEKTNTGKDRYLDRAERFIKKALKKAPNESELYVLLAFMKQGRILVSVIARGMRYIGEIESDLATARRLNPDNPRAYFLLGQSVLNKPGFIGGSKSRALGYFRTAKDKFATFQPENEVWPAWGEAENQAMLDELG